MANVIISGTSGKSGTLSDIYTKSRYNPVGTIKQSILSETQFQSKASNDWISADGRLILVSDCPDLYSAIGTTYGSGSILGSPAFRIPNMQDRYSRMTGTNSLGTCLGQGTAVGSLSIAGSAYCIQYYQTGFPSGWTNNPTLNGSATNHIHAPNNLGLALQHTSSNMLRYCVYTGSDNYFSDTYMASQDYTSGGACTTKGISVVSATTAAFNCSTQTASIAYTSATLSSSDSETRPETIVLNWFIKIK
jgi:microcystin-dependent protein